MNEFDTIALYFAPLTQGRTEAGGLQDDAAVLGVPPGFELVVTSDTLNAGTHFPEDAPPGEIARKALRVNLSDLAAMAASPYAYQLNIAFPGKPKEDWLEAFTAALAADQREFGIFCSGGDTTAIKGPLSVSITALGLVSHGKAVRRSGARAGDAILLTGPVGDAWIGWQVLEGKLATTDNDYFTGRYYRPRPRLDLADSMRAHAHAAIDVSDGLLADLGHVCRASGLRALVEMEKIPFSPQARAAMEAGLVRREQLLSGGDDYELVMAAPADAAMHFPGASAIGRFEAADPAVRLLDGQGRAIKPPATGWTHF